MDQKNKKTNDHVYKALYARDGVERLYVSRKEGIRGLASIEDNVDISSVKNSQVVNNNKWGEKLYMHGRN